MRYAHYVVLALALASPAGAQQPPLSLREALELARLHSPLLAVAAGHVRVAAGLARERAAPPNPVIELRQENIGGDPVLDRFATVTLPLDVRLERSAIRAAGRQSVAAAVADSAVAAREVEASVGKLYWSAALAHALAESAAMEEAALTELLLFEETRLNEGAVAEAVALRARLEVERARLATARARGAAAQAHAELARAIGLPAAELSHAQLETRTYSTALPSRAEAVERARLARPEMEAARRRVEAARWETTAARRGSLPDLGLQLGAMESAGQGAAIVGLSVELPVRDLGAGARARSAGELAIAEAELISIQQRVESEVASALEVYRRLMEVPSDGVGLAEQGAEVAAIAEMAYREGAVTLVELLDARRAHAEARAAAATRAAELAIARIELARVLGSPMEEGI